MIITKQTMKSPGYIQRAENIVSLYNKASPVPFDEHLNLTYPENTIIICSTNDSGGLLLDYHSDNDVYRVMFAAFDELNRGQGMLKACLNFAKEQSIDIAVIEINSSDEMPLWKSLGYTYTGAFGMTLTVSNKRLKFINHDAVIALR